MPHISKGKYVEGGHGFSKNGSSCGGNSNRSDRPTLDDLCGRTSPLRFDFAVCPNGNGEILLNGRCSAISNLAVATRNRAYAVLHRIRLKGSYFGIMQIAFLYTVCCGLIIPLSRSLSFTLLLLWR